MIRAPACKFYFFQTVTNFIGSYGLNLSKRKKLMFTGLEKGECVTILTHSPVDMDVPLRIL